MNNVKYYIAALMICGISANANAALTSGDFKEIRLTANEVCTSFNNIDVSTRGYKVEAIVTSKLNLFFAKASADVKAQYADYNDRSVLAKDVAKAIEYGVIEGDACKRRIVNTLVSAITAKPSNEQNQTKQYTPVK